MRFRRRSLIAIAASAVTILGLAGSGLTIATGATTTTAGPTLTEQLDTLLADARYRGSQVGLLVRDAGTGEVLYDRNSANRLIPASNLKLLTSAAALRTLGPDFRFHTDVLTTAPTSRGRLAGDLYLKGYGDPTTLAADYAELATQVAASGIRWVAGDIVADDTHFDDVRLASFWSWDSESDFFAAQTSALTVAPNTDYDPGTVIVRSLPGAAASDPVTLTLQPETNAVRLVNTATTGAAGTANTISVLRDHGTQTVRVSGSLPLGHAGGATWVTVWDPTRYAADVFRRALRAAGVQVSGQIRTGTAPTTTALARDESMPLSELLIPFMKLSNNMHAETLVKAIGVKSAGKGTWAAGLPALSAYLRDAGGDAAAVRITDGSGLSRANNLTADGITDVLLAVQREPWFDTWFGALPIAGNPDRFAGGTLRSRMAGTKAANNLRGKTGSLTGVTALSGFVSNADGRKLVFSMVSNNYIATPRPVEDAVGVTLASWSETAPAAAIRPARSSSPESDGLECSWRKAC